MTINCYLSIAKFFQVSDHFAVLLVTIFFYFGFYLLSRVPIWGYKDLRKWEGALWLSVYNINIFLYLILMIVNIA